MATEIAGPIQEEEALGKAYDGALMRRLLRYLEPYRWQVVPAVALLVSLAGMQIVGPWLVQIALDEAVPAANGRLVALLAIAYMASAVVAFGLEYGQMLVTTWLGQSVMRDLRREIFAHLQKLDLGFYDRNPVGRLMTRITSDVETLNNLFSSGVVAIFGDLVTLLFVVSAMLVMDWRLALVTFSVLPFVVWAAIVFRTRIRVAYRDIRVRMARINAYLHERITGIRGGAALQPGGTGRPEAREDQQRLPGGAPPVDHLLRPLLSDRRALHRYRPRADRLVRRALDPRRDDDGRRGRGLPPLCPAVLPPDPGPLGQVQPPPGGHGLIGADLRAPRPGAPRP